jgi:hypothetical protein
VNIGTVRSILGDDSTGRSILGDGSTGRSILGDGSTGRSILGDGWTLRESICEVIELTADESDSVPDEEDPLVPKSELGD